MVQMTEKMTSFLNERHRLGEADAQIAYRLMILSGARVADPDAPDYLDLVLQDDAPRVTYTTAKKAEGLEYQDRFTARGKRVIARPASVFQKVLGQKVDGYALDRIVGGAGVFLRPATTRELILLSGDDVWTVFTSDQLCSCRSRYAGIRSCMVHANPKRDRPGIKFYQDHCEIAVMLCQTCHKPTSRSIVWTTDDGVRRHDRCYGNYNDDQLFHRLLREAGIEKFEYGTGRYVKTLTAEQFAEYDALSFPALDTMNRRCDTCLTLANGDCPNASGFRTWNYGRRGAHGQAVREEAA